MCGFRQEFGAYISKIVNWFNLKKNQQVVFQDFVGDEQVEDDILCSKMELRVDSWEICHGIISAHSDQNMKPNIGQAFQKPSNMGSTVANRN